MKGENETQMEQIVYVSSSLNGIVGKDDSGGIGVVTGLAAFDDDYRIKSEIRQWELNTGSEISNRYMARLPSPSSTAVSIGGWVTTRTIGQTYRSMGGTFQDIANTYRAAQSIPPSYEVLRNTAIGSQVWGTANQISSAGITFMKTVDRIGTSMQIMNPPIYLHEKTSWGWKGEGSYPIPGGHVYYQEALRTSGPGAITRTHTDWGMTNMGSYVRNVEIKTPATSSFERFVVYHKPVGSYFDPHETTMTTITRSQQNYRVETIGGFPKSNWSIPQTNWGVPKTNWNIPSTNPFPTYTPSMPSTTYYPPPKILFLIKDPLSTYTSYTSPAFKMPTYTLTTYSPLGRQRY